MNCDEALHILLDSNHQAHSLKRSLALNYLRQHPACLARVDQLGRAILSDLDNELSCAEARLHLADYNEQQQIAPERSAQIFSDLHAHLEHCPDCRLEYTLLQSTLAALATDTLPAPGSIPTFDLSFIDKPFPSMRPTAAIWMLHDQLRTLFQQVEMTIRHNTATIAALTPQLAPQTFASAMRDSTDDTQFSVIVLPDEEAHIHFQVTTKPFQKQTATIMLRILATDVDMPIADVRVTLRHVNGTLVTSSLTDQSGEIEFPGIPAASYVIQAQIEGKTWAIPIMVIQG